MNCGIYLWTNVKNNKKYIGQSSNLHNRYLSFLNFDKPYAGGIINRARLKYNNKEFWSYQVLEYCNKEELDEREIYYINLYDSFNNGYNLSEGGNGTRGFKWTEQQKDKKRGENHPLYGKPAHNRGIPMGEEQKRKLSKQKKEYYKTHDAYFKGKHHTDDIKKKLSDSHKKTPIIQYTLEGEYVNEFKSICEASRITKINKATIFSCISRRSHIASGFIFLKKGEQLTEDILSSIPKREERSILQIAKDGTIVNEFKNAMEAERETCIHNGSIYKCLCNERKSAGGFIWKYKEGVSQK